ncbi:hypothetical protein [Lactobacillus pasteurii]|uniref:Uncharacterized protein n=1 Tax=Lactobacillus pasteurii DSM 23907 = CRBIP 24.76 TaxID=1423790 RepID=I7LD18_9LACO|nr:hypothetical protein [Lactobacillus pasteurii]CCI84498.1 Protein of unknown function [Lactobacillus pasteurii DSM 23907 = CRBIP 24.76]
MTAFIWSVIVVVCLLGILVTDLTVLTKNTTKWLIALKELTTAFHDLWKK